MAPHDEHDTALARALHEQQRLPLPLLQELLGEVRRGRAAGAGVSLAQLVVARGLLPAAAVEASQAVTARPAAPLAGQAPARLGPYRLLRRLGAGGMGAVYEAEHTATGARHALKLLEPEAGAELQERFLREARAMAAVDAHPHVARIHASGEERGWTWIAMELAPGGDLAGRLARGPLPPEEARALVADLADGLAFVHARGVLHRDLKPANVLFDGAGRALLTDFGLAKGVGERSLTQTGDLLGTPAYMAPEQALGRPLDARADVYALGAVLFACLTGRAPFEGGSLFALLERVVHEPPPSPRALAPAVPPELDAACLRALAKDPEARYPDASALAAALRSSPGPGGARSGRALVGASAALVALGGLLTLGLFVSRPGPPTPGPGRAPKRSPRARAEAPAPAPTTVAEAALARAAPVEALAALGASVGPEAAALRVEALLLVGVTAPVEALLAPVAEPARSELARALAVAQGSAEAVPRGVRELATTLDTSPADLALLDQEAERLADQLERAELFLQSLPRPIRRALADRLQRSSAWRITRAGLGQLPTIRARLDRLRRLNEFGYGHAAACAAAAWSAARARDWEAAGRLASEGQRSPAAEADRYLLGAVSLAARWVPGWERGEPPARDLAAQASRLARMGARAHFEGALAGALWETATRPAAEVLVWAAWVGRARPAELRARLADLEQLISDEATVTSPDLLLPRVAGHLLAGEVREAHALARAAGEPHRRDHRLALAEIALCQGDLATARRHVEGLSSQDGWETYALRLQAQIEALEAGPERALRTLARSPAGASLPVLPWRGLEATRRAIEAGWRPGTPPGHPLEGGSR